jgi:hypothetical protein
VRCDRVPRRALDDESGRACLRSATLLTVRVLGIDLAWGTVNETGVVALDPDGTIADAGWTAGVEDTAAWMKRWAKADTLAFIDAPLVVLNARGQRPCERQVGQCYGRWKVSANSTNIASPRLAGIQLGAALIAAGWQYHDGYAGPPIAGRMFSECYPYTTLVGAAELGNDDERPLYKRKPPKMRAAEWRPTRAANCDALIRRLENLRSTDPPLDLSSHPVTATLLNERSPLNDRDYKRPTGRMRNDHRARTPHPTCAGRKDAATPAIAPVEHAWSPLRWRAQAPVE